MNYNATITNFRGLASASLDISRICLLAGPNEAGKTSASQALAAALTGDPIPIIGVKKAQAGMLVRAGNANGSVDLVSDDGSTNVQWPSAKVKTEGTAPFSSHYAVGLQSIVNLDDKERVKVLTEYLKAVPTRADLDAQLAPKGLSTAKIDQIWNRIETLGWDGAQKHYEAQRAQIKGQWVEVTGEPYGSKKAASWVPDSWSDGLEGQSEDKLSAVVTDARDSLEAAIAADAVDDSKRADLEALAALLPARKIDALAANESKVDPTLSKQLEECQALIAGLVTDRDKLSAELRALPPTSQAAGMKCPSCQAVLHVNNGKLETSKVIPEAEIAERKTAIEAAAAQVENVNKALNGHLAAEARIKAQIADASIVRANKIAECSRLVRESEQAGAELNKPVAAPSLVTVDDCRSALAAAEINLKAFVSQKKAAFHHTCVEALESLITHIAPEGIRGEVLNRSLKAFNEKLAPLCKAASWRPVILESDFMPTYGGTIYLLLSESAKFRVRVILQMGMALADRSQMLVVDAADILDKGGRNGLFKSVKALGLPTLVSMTIDSKELVPNLGKAGIGASYWIQDAVVEPVA